MAIKPDMFNNLFGEEGGMMGGMFTMSYMMDGVYVYYVRNDGWKSIKYLYYRN